MAVVIINGNELELADDERLNGIQAAARLGIHIPHYCWHPGLSVVASCRMCLVETGRRDPQNGTISMVPKLVPACQTPATDGTVFVTDSPKVRAAQAMVEEDLLIRHPVDCPICDKAGECLLQDYHFQHGQPQRRADIKPFTSRRRSLGDTVTLFVDRCVMCSRCVRFTREISGTAELMVINRGAHEEIDVFPGYPLANKLSGNVVDLCPVGALGDKDFLYQQRVWFMKRHPHVCAGCATGCSIYVEENQDRIYRLKPRENPRINQWWICDEGRYGYHHVHSPRRAVGARRRHDGAYVPVEWSQTIPEIDRRLRSAVRPVFVLSPFLTVEEAYLLARYARELAASATIAVGPIPVVGEDESFPAGFVIRAEKCPNRRGVEAVAQHFQGTVVSFDELLEAWDDREADAVWVTGGYPSNWIDPSKAARLANTPLVIVQDLFPSPLWDQADYQLPGVAFAERSGSFINHHHRFQTFDWAIRPPAGTMVEGHVFWRLLGRHGLYRPDIVRGELADEIEYFAGAGEMIPDTGIELKPDRLAHAAAGVKG